MRIIEGIECYGEAGPTQNYMVVCEDQRDDWTCVTCGFEDWPQVVAYLKGLHTRSEILEISAI